MTKQIGIQLSLEGQQKVIDGIKDVGKNLDDMAKKSVASVSGSLSDLGGKVSSSVVSGLKNIGKEAVDAAVNIAKITAAAGTAAFTGGVAGSIKLAAGFEDANAQLKAMLSSSDRTQANFDLLEAKASEVGRNTSFSSKEAALGMSEFAQQGLNVKQTLEAIGPTAKAAELNHVNLADAAKVGSIAMNAFGLSAGDLPHVFDLTTKAAQMGVLSFDDFKAAMAAGGSVAKLANQSIETFSAGLIALTNTGQSASDSGTSMKAALLQLVSPGKEAQSAIDALGLSVRDQQGNMRPWSDIIAQIETKTKSMTKADRDFYLANLGGSDGIRAYAASLNTQATAMVNGKEVTLQGSAALKYYEDQLRNSNGEMDKSYKIVRDTFAGALDNAKGSIEEAGITIGKSLLTPLKNLLNQGVSPAINKFIVWEQATHGVGNALAGALNKVTGFISGLAPMAGKVLEVIQAISPLNAGVSIFEGFITNGAEGAIDSAGEVAKRIGAAFGLNLNSEITGTVGFLKTQLLPVFEEIGKSIGPAVSKIGDFIETILKIGAQSGIFKTFGDIVTGVVTTVGDVFGTLSKAFNDNKETISATLSTVGNVFKEVFAGAGEIIKFFAKLIGDNMPLISSLITTAGNTIRSVITVAMQIFNNLKPVIEAIVPPILQIARFLTDVFGKAFVGVGIIVERITSIFSRVPEAIETVRRIFVILGDAIGKIWSGISQSISLAWTIISEIFNKIVDFVKNTLTTAWDGLASTVRGAFNIVKRIMGGAVNGFIKLLNVILWAINKAIWAANKLGGWAGVKIDEVGYVDEINLDKMAGGGRARGGLTLVGEEGPELVNMNPGAMVYPNWMTSQMMQPSLPQTVVNNNNQQYHYGGDSWNMGVQTNNSPDAVMQSYSLMRAMAGGSAV